MKGGFFNVHISIRKQTTTVYLLCITAASRSRQMPVIVQGKQGASKVSGFGSTVLGKCRILILSKSELLPSSPGGKDSANSH